jgi:NAD(P)-dependent dehydrogenase (short-subunit alcohol dehydrogenase family)
MSNVAVMTTTVRHDFSGRVALVVGASRGIGAGAARAFAAAGASVVVTARSRDALSAVAAGIASEGGEVLAVPGDATQPTDADEVVQQTLSRYGRLDFAFNNATDGPMPAPLAEIEVDGFDAGIAGNVRATFLGCRAQLPAIIASGGGAVVNMASVAGLTGTANLAAYTAGKAGIIGLTKVAALDYADAGVRVNVVAPGPILTHHLERAGAYAQEQAARSVPMGRVGTVREVADVVLWLCSDEASFVTGAVVPIDGGQSAGHKPPQMYRQGESMTPPEQIRDDS